jgi:hypothetical protein
MCRIPLGAIFRAETREIEFVRFLSFLNYQN